MSETPDLKKLSQKIATVNENIGMAEWTIQKLGCEYPIGTSTFHHTELDIVSFLESAKKALEEALIQARLLRDAEDSVTSRNSRYFAARKKESGAA